MLPLLLAYPVVKGTRMLPVMGAMLLTLGVLCLSGCDRATGQSKEANKRDLPTLDQEIEAGRAELRRLEIRYAADKSDLNAAYKALEERRRKLPSGDAQKVTVFNRDAAVYQEQNSRLAEQKKQVAACDARVSELLTERGKLLPPPAASNIDSASPPLPPIGRARPGRVAPIPQTGPMAQGRPQATASVVTATVALNERLSLNPNGLTPMKLIIRQADHTNGIIYSVEDDNGRAYKTFTYPSGATTQKLYRPASTIRKAFESVPIPGTNLQGVPLTDGVYLVDEIGGENKCVVAYLRH